MEQNEGSSPRVPSESEAEYEMVESRKRTPIPWLRYIILALIVILAIAATIFFIPRDPKQIVPARDLKADSLKALIAQNAKLKASISADSTKIVCLKSLVAFGAVSQEAWRISSLHKANARSRASIDSAVSEIMDVACKTVIVDDLLRGDALAQSQFSIAKFYHEIYLKVGGS
jgi:hypothetical protein